MERHGMDFEDVAAGGEEEPIVPATTKRLRACLVSKLIKTEQQFLDDGCENVPELPMRGDRDYVLDCTTTDFEGCGCCCGSRAWAHVGGAHVAPLGCCRVPNSMVALMNPQTSWVGRWQGICACAAQCGGQPAGVWQPHEHAPPLPPAHLAPGAQPSSAQGATLSRCTDSCQTRW